jgi:hypothetical protein
MLNLTTTSVALDLAREGLLQRNTYIAKLTSDTEKMQVVAPQRFVLFE